MLDVADDADGLCEDAGDGVVGDVCDDVGGGDVVGDGELGPGDLVLGLESGGVRFVEGCGAPGGDGLVDGDMGVDVYAQIELDDVVGEEPVLAQGVCGVRDAVYEEFSQCCARRCHGGGEGEGGEYTGRGFGDEDI